MHRRGDFFALQFARCSPAPYADAACDPWAVQGIAGLARLQRSGIMQPNVVWRPARAAACLLAMWGAATVPARGGDHTVDQLWQAVLLYASFDEQLRADRAGGAASVRTRMQHETQPGQFVFGDGYDAEVFRIAPQSGIVGGALQVLDVLPRNGRIFFPAKGNLAYRPDGWGGAVSFWINTDPNTQLKTPFCDPVQITQRGANNGGLWVDFPDTRPRDFRLGAFPAAAPGQPPLAESDPDAPLVRVREIGFRSGDWHHVVMTWERFDTQRADAQAALYIDGERAGLLCDRNIAMRWDLEHTGIYVAVNFIGLMDELAVFSRPLRDAEIQWLFRHPDVLQACKHPAK
jgi:hypothetical protein